MSELQGVLAQPLRDFVDLDFARRLEMAETMTPEWVASMQRANPLQAIASQEIAGGTAFFGGPAYPANQILGMGLYGEVASDDVDRVEQFFRSRGVTSAIVVSPLADPSLLALLGQRGYRVAEFNSVLIQRISAEEPAPRPASVTIERATPETDGPWMRALAQGFSDVVPVEDNFLLGFSGVPGNLAFLARLDGKIAGGSAGRILPKARILALCGSSTLPQFRRRGVQSALIAQRLQEAALAGCEYAVVSTQPGSGSQRNMERKGFRVAYTKVVMMRDWPELSNQ